MFTGRKETLKIFILLEDQMQNIKNIELGSSKT